MRAVLEFIHMNAADTTPIAILGEPGTGRRFIARLLHELSLRSAEPFLILESRTMPAGLEASRQAGGTIVFSGIEALPPRVVRALMRTRSAPGFRLIATGDQSATLAAGDRRIVLPPLRERREDVPTLTDLFLARTAPTGRAVPPVSPSARQVLHSYGWPGNIRELREVCAWIGRTCTCRRIKRGCLPARVQRAAATKLLLAQPSPGLDAHLREIESKLIVGALVDSAHNRSRAARLLKIKRSTLGDRIRRLGIETVGEDVA